MNATERKYAARLERLKREGKIVSYEYEGETLLITRKMKRVRATVYTPDFVVLLADGRKEYHEVKIVMSNGRTRCQGAARQKFIDAAAKYEANVFVMAALHQDGKSWRLDEPDNESATITPEERTAGRSGGHALVARCGDASTKRGASTRRRSE